MFFFLCGITKSHQTKLNQTNQTQEQQSKIHLFCLFVQTAYPKQTKPNQNRNSCTDLYLLLDGCVAVSIVPDGWCGFRSSDEQISATVKTVFIVTSVEHLNTVHCVHTLQGLKTGNHELQFNDLTFKLNIDLTVYTKLNLPEKRLDF